MRIMLLSFIFFIAGMLSDPGIAISKPAEKFAVYYSDAAPAAQFKPFDVIVLDENYPSIAALSEQGKTLLGYISMGEVTEQSPYFSSLRNKGLLIRENPNWKGSHYVDIRSAYWQGAVIEDLVPKILSKGFNGIFIDTLDSPLDAERENPKTYSGMSDAAVKLLKAIRMHYPSMKIMVNRAYPILPRIAPIIDMELGESVFTDYDFTKKTYAKVDPDLYRQQIKWLQDAKKINPSLSVYTLDYADPLDSAFIREIYNVQRANGFTPYVATINLEEIVDEPAR